MKRLPTCPNCGRLLRWVGKQGPADSGYWCDECDYDPHEKDPDKVPPGRARGDESW
jgi:tRNA(Ile2) C34 agmatinyltransferase TiaS